MVKSIAAILNISLDNKFHQHMREEFTLLARKRMSQSLIMLL